MTIREICESELARFGLSAPEAKEVVGIMSQDASFKAMFGRWDNEASSEDDWRWRIAERFSHTYAVKWIENGHQDHPSRFRIP